MWAAVRDKGVGSGEGVQGRGVCDTQTHNNIIKRGWFWMDNGGQETWRKVVWT